MSKKMRISAMVLVMVMATIFSGCASQLGSGKVRVLSYNKEEGFVGLEIKTPEAQNVAGQDVAKMNDRFNLNLERKEKASVLKTAIKKKVVKDAEEFDKAFKSLGF